jgi:hypothetical protein
MDVEREFSAFDGTGGVSEKKNQANAQFYSIFNI